MTNSDIFKSCKPKARVLLINHQLSHLEEMERILVEYGYEVRSSCKETDAVSIAKSFFTVESNCSSAKEFCAQFVMLGHTLPTELGAELYMLDRHITKIIHWGDIQHSENYEKRREYYDFELLPTPIDSKKLHADLTSWIAEAWTDNGNQLYGKEFYSEAFECYEETLKIDPSCVSGWLSKAFSLSEMDQLSDAVECCDKAIDIDTTYWKPIFDKGFYLSQMGRYDDAIRCFDNALKLSQDLIGVWKERGIALDALGRYEEAINSFDEVFKIKYPGWTEYGRASSYSDALNLKGSALAHASRYNEAITCYDNAIDMNPEYSFPYYNKAIALSKMGLTDEAILWYEKALEIAPWHSGCWHNAGILLRDQGQLQEAISYFKKALDCEEPEILAWYNMGRAFEDLGQLQNAQFAYEKYLAEAKPDGRQETKDRAEERLRDLQSRIGNN